MKKEIILQILNNHDDCYSKFNTDIAIGRGINGVDYREFRSSQYDVNCGKDYMTFSKENNVFFVEYEHIVGVEIYTGKYDYKCGGIS